jgi:uncharacterized tellurite resistance protein B-like protein
MDQELIDVFRKKLQREERIRLFSNATGIRDKQRLESLVNSDLELPALTALFWVPLTFVAWADGVADGSERKAIREVLSSKGMSHSTISMMFDHNWFRQQPSEELWLLWEQFAASTLATLDPVTRKELVENIGALCQVVAQASGGFLGFGSISAKESEVIGRVMESLNRFSIDSAFVD